MVHIQYFVYCSGKTGSTTLYDSLKVMGSSIHVHNTYFYNQRQRRKYGNVPLKKLICQSAAHYAKQGKKIYIIDSYRPTIDRRISAFFQKKENTRKYCVKKLIQIFNQKEMYDITKHSYLESFPMFGLDTNIKFDFEKGYYMTQVDNMVFVKLRIQDSKRWGDILSSIVGQQVKIIRKNTTSDKRYEVFKKRYKAPYHVIDPDRDYENNREDKKFMTPEEHKEYIRRWTKSEIK